MAGGLIIAASKKDAAPTIKVGSISVIKRIVLIYMKAGISPIVVVTGFGEPEVKAELMKLGVIFIKNEDYEKPPLLSSIKRGLAYMKDKCDKTVITPVNVPMFSPQTVIDLVAANADFVIPSYQMRGGHPVVVANHTIDSILAYQGDNGLKGAMNKLPYSKQYINVADRGIHYSIHHLQQLEDYLAEHNRLIEQLNFSLSISRETIFMDKRVHLLLKLIDQTHSVDGACKQMSLSKSKAWKIINQIERELGIQLVIRQHGGSKGGGTYLSPAGKSYVEKYSLLNRNIREFVNREYQRIFQPEAE